MATHVMYLRKLLEVVVFLQHYIEVQCSPLLYIHACINASLIPQTGQYGPCKLGHTVAQQPVIPEEVGSDHVYVNKCMMSHIANSIPLR